MLGFDWFTKIRIISGSSAGLAQKWRFLTVELVYFCCAKQFSLVSLAEVSSLFNCLTGTARENKWA